MNQISTFESGPQERAEAFRSLLASTMHFALPGIVQSFDPTTQTAEILPAIHDRLRDGAVVELPLLRDVPVFFPGGRSSAMTYPVTRGDECLVIFSDACIDEWYAGTDPAEASSRRHDLSDAFAFVGFRSRANALENFPDEPSFFGE